MKSLVSCVFALSLLTSTPPFQKPAASVYKIPPALNDEWKVGNADSVGVDSKQLADLTSEIRAWPELGVHAIVIERDGKLIFEEYFRGYDEQWGKPLDLGTMTSQTKHDLRSVTKSVISALVGIALGEGAIRSLEQPIIEYFPEYPELNTPERRQVTLAHALSMTSGFEWNEDIPYSDPRNDEIRMTRDPHPLRFALTRKFVSEPGSNFNYNGGLTQVMAAVLVRATKSTLQDYARTRLFEPLGITDVEWMGELAGMPAAASGLRLRARDLAKFGSLYLHSGKWNGKQVIPTEWVERSTKRHFRFRREGTSEAGESGYSYFWWYNCRPTESGLIETRTAVGNGQQRIFVMPGLNMVVTIFAGRYNDFRTGATLSQRILLQHVIPAVRTDIRPGCRGA
jgi:CubicO group peptidase (beta-lactamase class C family)